MKYKEKKRILSTLFGDIDINSTVYTFVKRTDTYVVLECVNWLGVKIINNVPISYFESNYEVYEK